MARGKEESLSLMEAVDNLSSMAELDTSLSPEERGAKDKIEKIHLVKWLDPAKAEENRKEVKETFKVLNNYLHHVYSKGKEELKDVEMQKGIQAIMVLAGEAAQKLDKFSGLFKGAHGEGAASELDEYKDLQKFYLTKMVKRFQESLEKEEAFEKQWSGVDQSTLDFEKRGLRDLETVRRDKEYELFYIRKEDNNPFFSRNLLRHIRLVGDFDETLKDTDGMDPFLRVQVIQDKDVHLTAKGILKLSMMYIDDFYKEAMRHKELTFVLELNKALMALMLAANPRNLRENTTGKSALSYFRDFHQYLRLALGSDEYAQYIAVFSQLSDRFSHTLINLSHSLCCFLFLRTSSRKEAVEFIHKLIKKGGKEPDRTQPFWSTLLDEDESIRTLLKRYPNGPLLKTLDTFREGEGGEGFDPILQDNLPSQLFTFDRDSLDVTALRIASPTFQEVIHKAEINQEFKGFLRYLNTRLNGEKHLLFNLQDRTSWREHARALALEEMPKKEDSQNLIVVTLPKDTEFYHQSGSYSELNKARHFIETFRAQVEGGELCGFYFPKELSQKEILAFTEHALKFIHTAFFENKEKLLRKDRLDFIEMFYLLFEMKIVEMLHPDSLSFTSKDAIDTGASTNVSFYAFLKMLSASDTWSDEEKDFVLWMLYSPALMVRERAIDSQCFNRTVSVLAHLNIALNTHKKEILKGLNKLYGKDLFSEIKLSIAS